LASRRDPASRFNQDVVLRDEQRYSRRREGLMRGREARGADVALDYRRRRDDKTIKIRDAECGAPQRTCKGICTP
jgi:hypothetical protein